MHYRLEENMTEVNERLGKRNAVKIANSLPKLLKNVPTGLAAVVHGEFDTHTGSLNRLSKDQQEPKYRMITGSFLAVKTERGYYASPVLPEQEMVQNNSAAQVIGVTIRNCNLYWRSI